MVSVDASVFLFIGNENYLKEEALKELKGELLGRHSQELDYKIFYGNESCAREILDYVTTIPFSAAKKLVVIKDLERLSQEDKGRLAAYIKKPARFTNLVLDAADASILEELRPVIRYIEVSRYDRLTDPEVRSWIKRFAASKGKAIEDAAVEILKELQGANLSSLTQELEKLIAFVGEAGVIKSNDVEALVGRSHIESAFDIGWAVGEKRAGKALSLVSDLTLRGKKPHEIIGLLHWHLKRILKAKVLLSKNESDSSIGEILRIDRRRSLEFFKQARSYDIDQIRSATNILLKADLDVKNARYDSRLTLELAIVKLCFG